MILKLIFGKTPQGLGATIDRAKDVLARAERRYVVKMETVAQKIDQAVADRTATIDALKEDVVALETLRSQL